MRARPLLPLPLVNENYNLARNYASTIWEKESH